MKTFFSRILIAAIVLATSSCNEPFSPNGPFEPHMVVYSVLTTQSDTQYARVYANYEGYNSSSDNADTTAQVVISTGNLSAVLRATLLPRNDQTKYSTPIRAFFAYPFKVQPESTYTIMVTSSILQGMSASTTVPGKGAVRCDNHGVMDHPDYITKDPIIVVADLAQNTIGYQVRLLIEYGLRNDSSFVAEKEVPAAVGRDRNSVPVLIYPSMERKTADRVVFQYRLSLYVYTIQEIYRQYGTTNVAFKRAKFYLLQTDEHLFTYYNVANGFQDPYSIRTDQPDYSNIPGGLGVFGSFNADSVYYDLPSTIIIERWPEQ